MEASGDFVNQFHRLHEQRYGYADPQRPVEVVNVRVRMISCTEPLPLPAVLHQTSQSRHPDRTVKRVYDDGQWLEGQVYRRSDLAPGDRFNGPAVVTEYSATTFVPPRCKASVDSHGNLLIEVQP